MKSLDVVKHIGFGGIQVGYFGAALRVLAVITDPRVIAAILAHLQTRAARAPPPVRH